MKLKNACTPLDYYYYYYYYYYIYSYYFLGFYGSAVFHRTIVLVLLHCAGRMNVCLFLQNKNPRAPK